MIMVFPVGYVGGGGWNDNHANSCPNTRQMNQTARGDRQKLGLSVAIHVSFIKVSSVTTSMSY